MLSNRGVSKDEMENQTEIRDGLSNNGTSIDTLPVDKYEKESCDASCNKDVEQDGVSSFNRVGKEALEDAVKNFKENNPPKVVKATCQMLLLYITNLEDNPTSERYQKIYTTSNKFKTLIANVPYATEVLYALGFVKDGSFLKWTQLDKNECETSIMLQLLKDAKITLKLVNEEIKG
jgi:PUB domain.